MAYLRLPFCSPYKLFWPFTIKPATPSEKIHRAYARYVWGMYGIKAVPKVVFYGVIWGARTSLYLSVIVVSLCVTIGVLVGSAAGFLGGR